jgi:hypothetical protein
MPFTFAHPSVILPLKQAKPGWFSFSALVAGSMAPDFEYFFKVRAISTVSETTAGIFTFNLPVALGICLAFHLIIRNPLVRHLPRPFDKRFSGFLNFNFLNYLKRHPLRFLASALIGVISHLGLDALTSPETMARSFQRLQQLALNDKGLQLQASLGDKPFLALEKVFSVASLFLIGYILLNIKNPAPRYRSLHPRQKRKYFIVFFSLLIMGEVAAAELLPYGTEFAQLVVNTISAGLLSLLITSLIFRK